LKRDLDTRTAASAGSGSPCGFPRRRSVYFLSYSRSSQGFPAASLYPPSTSITSIPACITQAQPGIRCLADMRVFRLRTLWQQVLPYLDVIYYEIKVANPKAHRRHTGRDNLLFRSGLEVELTTGAERTARRREKEGEMNRIFRRRRCFPIARWNYAIP
jgi:hypothetical protein